MRHKDNGRLKPERGRLDRRSLLEGRCRDHDAGNTAFIEIPHIVHTARCTRASIRERVNDDVHFLRHLLRKCHRQDLGIGRLRITTHPGPARFEPGL